MLARRWPSVPATAGGTLPIGVGVTSRQSSVVLAGEKRRAPPATRPESSCTIIQLGHVRRARHDSAGGVGVVAGERRHRPHGVVHLGVGAGDVAAVRRTGVAHVAVAHADLGAESAAARTPPSSGPTPPRSPLPPPGRARCRRRRRSGTTSPAGCSGSGGQSPFGCRWTAATRAGRPRPGPSPLRCTSRSRTVSSRVTYGSDMAKAGEIVDHRFVPLRPCLPRPATPARWR